MGRTLALTLDGYKLIEDITVGDTVLSCPKDRPDDPAGCSVIEEVFHLSTRILELRVSGQIVETTEEYRFFVAYNGWVAAKDLDEGDVLRGHDSVMSVVESTYYIGRVKSV